VEGFEGSSALNLLLSHKKAAWSGEQANYVILHMLDSPYSEMGDLGVCRKAARASDRKCAGFSGVSVFGG
jgi:hypothetical protein